MHAQTLNNALLENNCSEQASRMSAMESSTKNAKEMLDRLTLSYNRRASSFSGLCCCALSNVVVVGCYVICMLPPYWLSGHALMTAGRGRRPSQQSSLRLYLELQLWRDESDTACVAAVLVQTNLWCQMLVSPQPSVFSL